MLLKLGMFPVIQECIHLHSCIIGQYGQSRLQTVSNSLAQMLTLFMLHCPNGLKAHTVSAVLGIQDQKNV